MNERVVFVLYFALSVMGAGCHDAPQDVDLCGKYVTQYPFGSETLYLESGGRCLQEVIIDATERRSATQGTWRFDAKTRNVMLDDCLLVIDGFGALRSDFETPTRGTIVLPVRGSRKRPVLVTGEVSSYVKCE